MSVLLGLNGKITVDHIRNGYGQSWIINVGGQSVGRSINASQASDILKQVQMDQQRRGVYHKD